LCVSPENFRSQISYISDRFQIVPLIEIGRALAKGRPLENVVAITFDDGYADNLYEAAPILKRYHCPATVFATTGHTGTFNEFFWDDLDRILLSPGKLPQKSAAHGIDLKDSADFDGRSPAWNVLHSTDPTPRHEAYRQLTTKLHSLPAEARQDILHQLQSWAKVPFRNSHRMMSAEEMKSLTNDGLITIGGHTVDHPRLSSESLELQRSQIELNRWQLGSPAAFSYPFGTRHDYTADTVELVKESSYELACANFGGIVTEASDRYRLPRRIVRDWAVEPFARELEGWIWNTLPAMRAAG
jgi:peptidoglycan/xylan/chitin deacetylase (PgdA/CDA1 family)